MRHFPLALTAVLALSAVTITAQRANDPIRRITEADLKRDLFALAGDEMRGREGGTLDEMAASPIGRIKGLSLTIRPWAPLY